MEYSYHFTVWKVDPSWPSKPWELEYDWVEDYCQEAFDMAVSNVLSRKFMGIGGEHVLTFRIEEDPDRPKKP